MGQDEPRGGPRGAAGDEAGWAGRERTCALLPWLPLLCGARGRAGPTAVAALLRLVEGQHALGLGRQCAEHLDGAVVGLLLAHLLGLVHANALQPWYVSRAARTPHRARRGTDRVLQHALGLFQVGHWGVREVGRGVSARRWSALQRSAVGVPAATTMRSPTVCTICASANPLFCSGARSSPLRCRVSPQAMQRECSRP